MLVEEILKSKTSEGVVTIGPDASISEAARVLSDRGIGAVIVSSDGTSAEGILSERDIVRELGRRGSGCLNDRVDALMTARLIGCTREHTALEVLEKMSEGRFRHMPVMEGDRMVGLISIGDVVKARLAELAMERDALEGMVMGH